MIYKFRSDRGAVHISPVHSANQMDSMLIMHAGKWVLGELLRLRWNDDRRVVGEVIEQLVQLEHPIIHELDGKPLVLARDITAPEEVLLLLNHSQNNRMTRSELQSLASHKAANVNVAMLRLARSKEVRIADNGDVALAPPGQKRVFEEVSFFPKYGGR